MDIDPNKPVSELTVAELMELVRYTETRTKYTEAERHYREQVAALEGTKGDVARIFNECNVLAATTPFRLFSVEDADKFVKGAVSEFFATGGKSLLVAVAFEGE